MEHQNVKMVRPPGTHLKFNFDNFSRKCVFLSKCFSNIAFRPFLGDRKGRQKGSRASGGVGFTFAPILPKTFKWNRFGTLVESICRLKSFMGRYRNSRTKTRDMRTPPRAPTPPGMSGHAGPMEPFGEEN